jgi:hypothetical protein
MCGEETSASPAQKRTVTAEKSRWKYLGPREAAKKKRREFDDGDS